MRHSIALITEPPRSEPGLDAAIGRALLDRVSSGLHPEALRLYVPGRIVAFGSRDTTHPSFRDAVAAAEAAGFRPERRLAGGRAAVFHEDTVAFAWAIPERHPRATIRERFDRIGEILVGALRSLGVDARIGEVPGEYCPGSWSINARSRRKLVGIGQRLVADAAHVGGVIVVDQPDLVNLALEPVYAALAYEWDPGATGSVAGETPVSIARVVEAVRMSFAGRFELVETRLDAETRARAEKIAPTFVPRAG